MTRKIRNFLTLASLLGFLVLVVAGCKVHQLTVPDPQGIATTQYVLKLDIVPDTIDINNLGTATANLRAHLTDWHGSNLAGKTIFFQVNDITVTFSAQVDAITTTRDKETQKDCTITNTATGPQCNFASCTAPVTTKDTTQTQTTTSYGVGCTATLSTETIGRINTRYVKTGPDGMAVTTYYPYPSHKAFKKITADLTDDVDNCASVSLSVTVGTSFDTTIEEVDLDNDGTNDVCRVTETTSTTSFTITRVVWGLPDFFYIPIQASWIEASTPDQVTDTNLLKIGMYQWNND